MIATILSRYMSSKIGTTCTAQIPELRGPIHTLMLTSWLSSEASCLVSNLLLLFNSDIFYKTVE